MSRAAYRLELAARVTADHDRYEFRTADGVCSKDAFRPAELQLLEYLWGRDLGDLCCVQANYGVVGTVLAPSARSVMMTESSARAARLCEQNAAAHDVDATVSLAVTPTGLDPATTGRPFDTVAYAPKPYTPVALVKQRLSEALDTLAPDGHLYIAARRHAGGDRYESYLREHAASVERVDSGDGCRVLRVERPRSVDSASLVVPRTIDATIDGVDLSLVTLPGLFAAASVDAGTRRLLEIATVRDGERVLDLCCGYGTIGVHAALSADCDVWLSDDDRLATRCAARSLAASGADGEVVTADCIDGVADRTFDRILCNPPTHAGDGVLDDLFTGAHDVLRSDGRLVFVHHRSLDLSDQLKPFGTVTTLHDGPTYTVHRARP